MVVEWVSGAIFVFAVQKFGVWIEICVIFLQILAQTRFTHRWCDGVLRFNAVCAHVGGDADEPDC